MSGCVSNWCCPLASANMRFTSLPSHTLSLLPWGPVAAWWALVHPSWTTDRSGLSVYSSARLSLVCQHCFVSQPLAAAAPSPSISSPVNLIPLLSSGAGTPSELACPSVPPSANSSLRFPAEPCSFSTHSPLHRFLILVRPRHGLNEAGLNSSLVQRVF